MKENKMKRFFILPYKQGSKSAKALAVALGGRVLRVQGSVVVPRAGDTIVNWGRVEPFPVPTILNIPVCRFLNQPEDIRRASNKLNFFRLMREDAPEIIPEFWETQDAIPDSAFPIVCRTVLAGHSGDGIVIASNRSELVPCSLYVRYMKKMEEYRIHVGIRGPDTGYPHSEGDPFSEVISVQRKARRLETPDNEVNWKVRNHDNGFVYVRGGVNPPAQVIEYARRALDTTGLDFGAVDVIWNTEKQRAYVLEINTAPGLEGQTVEDYTNFFKG